MKRNWEYKNIEECLEKVPVTSKLQTKDFLSEGVFPIVSQEADYVSGYWNNESDVVHLLHPVVVFGDHSRVVKYIDFDFVVGADGVKILSPKDFLNPKFLYYFVKSADIPSLGYSRHYKLLREKDVPIPPLEVQSRVVAELDLLTGIIDKQNAQLKELDNLAQAIFYDMFGDPIENPKGWEVKKWNEVFRLKSGDNLTAKDFVDGEYPVYGGNGISGYHNAYNKEGSFIIVGRVGAYCGNVRFVQGKFWLIDNAFEVFFDKSSFDFNFLCSMLNAYDLHRYANQAAQPVISNAGLKDIDVILPPLALQQSFAEKIQSIEKQKEAIRASIADTQKLLDYTMDKYFG